ncbi:intracellular proteinase inhibitor [Bacillus sp. V3B]|uniref:intracellular proteinase inhibitor n=1 Tax=Bacillus sp. V3B TaxID=2804915 RepID=UPI002108D74C|nr:intracellular proteinase inhibitor [Bacillus sp. V3B]MCQ6274344.1 intracellular proteinase inhibitor [Bacillus sp. V3B]
MIQVILLLSSMLIFQAGNEMETEKIAGTNHLQVTVVDEQSENPIFKDIVASGKKGVYLVTGQVNLEKDEFFYTVEDGHNEYISETPVKVSSNGPTGNSFELAVTIPAEKLPQNGTLILNLYEKSKSGQILNNFPVVLETFNNKQS